MRAFVIEAPGVAGVRDVAEPHPRAREVVVRVRRAGVCGTDRELFAGTIAGASTGSARTPGHEWVGVVERVGRGADADLLGRRVIGDTFAACRRSVSHTPEPGAGCVLCDTDRVALCPRHLEVGVKGLDGALAEFVRVPAKNVLRVPDDLDDAAAAMVEPLSNVVRAFTEIPRHTRSVLIRGAGALGLLAARVAARRSIRAVVVDPSPVAAARARAHGIEVESVVPSGLRVDAVLDFAPVADFAPAIGALHDGGTLVLTGFPSADATLPARAIVERDLTVIGTLGAAAHLRTAVDTARAISAGDLAGPTEPLEAVVEHLRGERPESPVKVHIDPAVVPSPAGDERSKTCP